MSKNIGARIKTARNNLGITLKELADYIGRTEATVQRYESGNIKQLDNEIIAKIAERLKVSPTYLMGWTDIETTKTIQIPILGTIACGNPITAVENVEEYKSRIESELPSGELFYLKAQGDSMSPIIESGSLVLCRVQENVENGEIAAVLVNGDTEATLKRVKKLNGYMILEPINDNYDSYIVDENNPARIVGKAIEVVNKL